MKKTHRPRTPKPPLQRIIAERMAELSAEFLAKVISELVETGVDVIPANAMAIAERRRAEHFSKRLRAIVAEYKVPAGMTPEEFEGLCLAEYNKMKDDLGERARKYYKTSRF